MSLQFEQLLLNYFSNKPIDFSALNSNEKENVFDISLSYPDLFSQISSYIDKDYFYDEKIERGSFDYYPHRFLTIKENANWLVEHCPILTNSFFTYSDWYRDDEYNLEVKSEYMIPSKTKEYHQLLKQEADFSLSSDDFAHIIENMIDACLANNFIPENTEGIEEVITENTTIDTSQKNILFEKVKLLKKTPSAKFHI